MGVFLQQRDIDIGVKMGWSETWRGGVGEIGAEGGARVTEVGVVLERMRDDERMKCACMYGFCTVPFIVWVGKG